MRRLMYFLLPLLLAVPAAAQPGENTSFSEALTRLDFEAAASILKNLARERMPADGRPRPDPLVNAYAGQMYATARHYGEADIILRQAPSDSLPAGLRSSTRLAHALSLERIGQFDGALAQYREAAAVSSKNEERWRASLGVARTLLVSRPGEVPGILSRLEPAPQAYRWEVSLLLAQAHALAGNAGAAEEASQRAWLDAARAPPETLAPLRVAALKAGLAALRKDRQGTQAMLNAMSGNTLRPKPRLMSQLPVCGDNGIQPDDSVIIGIASAHGHEILVPVSQSRPGLMTAFVEKVAGSPLLEMPSEDHIGGTVVTLRCRTTVSSMLEEGQFSPNPLLEWYVERGLNSVLLLDDTRDVNALADRIDQIRSRFGKDSELLIPLRAELADGLLMRASEGQPVSGAQVAELLESVIAGLKRVNGPPALILHFSQLIEGLKAAELDVADGPDPARSAQLFRKAFRDLPFEVARRALNEIKAETDEQKRLIAEVVADLDARRPAELKGRSEQAWSLRVSQAQRLLGRDGQASKRASSALGPDVCEAMDSDPELASHAFSHKDYPSDLVAALQQGYNYLNFDLDRNGKPINVRQVVSMPSGLFDEASTKGIAGTVYTPPRRNGRPSPCGSVFQPVVWRLEKENRDMGPPTLPRMDLPGTI